MCGILGHISNQSINQTDFLANLLRLNHRGPDDRGVYFEDSIALGQTRLSIVDLSKAGHQPMISKCGNYIIIYNGEIYNFKNIKDDLIAKNHKFYSHTDTEVILNGFIEYKEEIVNKLNGMFAFSIYNKSTKELFLARDKSGIKPLYYYHDREQFVFSSELKVLKKHSPNVSLEAKILFLLLGSVPEPVTIYENIVAFPAGHYGVYKSKKLKTVKYDEYSFEPKINKPYKEIIKDVGDLFDKSIQRHLISDAPIGVFLSGGLDSSAITAIAAKYKKNLRTLSLVFEDKSLNEEYYQNLVVDKYSTSHTQCLIDERLFLDGIDVFFNTMEQPTIDGLNTYFVSRAAKESGLKAVLSGVGADEIFYGYPSFKHGNTLKFLSKIPYSLIKIFEFSRKYKKLELLKAELEFAYYLPKRALFSPKEIAQILKLDKSLVYQSITNLWKTYSTSHVNQIEDKIAFFELNMYMKNQLLSDCDVFSMANSLEVRIPFLDKTLVDYVLKIAPEQKFGTSNKQILVDVIRQCLPNEIINRPKMGFVLPFESWFRKNIELFTINNNLKTKFVNKQLHWSKIWALLILAKFDENL